ncbi:MAG: hypothetical protein ACREH5_05825 [Candidatus Omnitrophota bacterium]
MRTGKAKRRFFVKSLLVLSLAGAALFLLQNRREALREEFTRFIQTSLSRQTGAEVRIGRIGGRFLGEVRFEDIEIREPWLPAEQGVFFRADEILFRYSFLDFISKSFHSKVEVIIKRPAIRWHPHLSLRKSDFPFMEWTRQWALSQKNRFVVRIEDLSFDLGPGRKPFTGVDLRYEDNAFSAEIPVSHVTIAKSDVSSVVHVDGHFEEARPGLPEALVGQIRTEGTIINWKPLREESRFEFILTEDVLRLVSSNFLGGIEVAGEMDLGNDYVMDFSIRAKQYPFMNLDVFFQPVPGAPPPSRMDLEARFHGSPWSPMVECRTRLYDGSMGKRSFKAMDVNVSGVYPTVRLEDSRILLEDGATMRIADRTLEAGELFKNETYEKLIEAADQSRVTWGDWDFTRSTDMKAQPEFLMERSLGDRTRVHLKRMHEDQGVLGDEYSRQTEVGLAYQIRAKDYLRFELREDEEFFGVERKLRF